ncbi:V-type sodium ATP synthase subunit E [Clostridia bacterium]|nr:V-type sodium ATP synthase subunit E [Clostridia bacterium]
MSVEIIQKMTEKILSVAEVEIEKERQREKKKIDEEMAREREQFSKQDQNRREKTKKQIEQEYKQKSAKNQVEQRQFLLKAKQKHLDSLFHEVVLEMENWGSEVVEQFALEALVDLELEEAVEAEIVPGEKSKHLLSQKWLNRLNQQSQRKYLLAQDFVEGKSGFLVRQGGIEYNFLFSVLVKQIQEMQSHEVIRKLFGEG